MRKKPDNIIKLDSETLSLCEFKTGGSRGFWIYDATRGMNLAMRADSEAAAFVEALHYYQERLIEVERAHADLQNKVTAFVSQFSQDDENGDF